jgi:hypothetical protein
MWDLWWTLWPLDRFFSRYLAFSLSVSFHQCSIFTLLSVTDDTYTYITVNSIFFGGEGPRSRCYGRTAALRLIVQPCDEDEEKVDQFFFIFPSNGAPVEWNWQGKTEVLGGKTCLNATLSTTNPTWIDPGSNPGLRGERPAINPTASLRNALRLGTF